MRLAIITAFSALIAVNGAAATATATARKHPYRQHWKHSVAGKGAVGRVTAGAGVNQLRHRPSKYGGGVAGFGKRVGAGLATNAVSQTVEHGVAAKLHEDLHYHPSTKRGFGPRMRHALTSTVVTHNTHTGKRRPAAGRLAGHAAAGAFTQGVLAAGSGASTAGIGLAADAGANVAREFIPKRGKKARAHKK